MCLSTATEADEHLCPNPPTALATAVNSVNSRLTSKYQHLHFSAEGVSREAEAHCANLRDRPEGLRAAAGTGTDGGGYPHALDPKEAVLH